MYWELYGLWGVGFTLGNGKSERGLTMWLIVVLGVIAYLVMEHSTVFWLVFIPLIVLFLASIVGLFKNKRAALSSLFWIVFIFVIIIIALVLAVVAVSVWILITPEQALPEFLRQFKNEELHPIKNND